MFERFNTRSYELERLDTGDYTPAEYERWHREMWYIHRFFGELRALKNSLLKAIEANENIRVSVLDVGAGAGELLSELKKWTAGREMFLVGAEINYGAAISIRNAGLDGVQCNALQLPFEDNSFTYVFCTLFMHHLGDAEAVKLLREMGRVAAEGIFVIDLNRHPTAYYSYKLFGSLVLQRFTLEDGALSILRSFTAPEMLNIAKTAGLSEVAVKCSKLNRLILTGK